jgi:hypothetical protein
MVVARCYRSIGWATLAFERGFPAIALDVHLQDRSVVHEPIDGRQRHGLVGENLAPFAERLVGRDEQGSAFIAWRSRSRSRRTNETAGPASVIGNLDPRVAGFAGL